MAMSVLKIVKCEPITLLVQNVNIRTYSLSYSSSKASKAYLANVNIYTPVKKAISSNTSSWKVKNKNKT